MWTLSGSLSIVVTVLSVTFWRLWGTLATKVELLATKNELVSNLNALRDQIVTSDYEHDADMENRLRGDINVMRSMQVEMHRQNFELFNEIRGDIKSLIRK